MSSSVVVRGICQFGLTVIVTGNLSAYIYIYMANYCQPKICISVLASASPIHNVFVEGT